MFQKILRVLQNRRKQQIAVRHLRSVTSSVALIWRIAILLQGDLTHYCHESCASRCRIIAMPGLYILRYFCLKLFMFEFFFQESHRVPSRF